MAQISVDSLMGNNGPTYPEQIATPFRKELTDNGFTQMLTPEDVEKALQRNDGKISHGCFKFSLWLRCKSSKTGRIAFIIRQSSSR